MSRRASARAAGAVVAAGDGACAGWAYPVVIAAHTTRAAAPRVRRRLLARSLNTSAAFLQRVQAIDGKVFPALFKAVRPSYVDPIDAGAGGESEVHTQIVLRQVAAAAADLLPLLDPAGQRPHARADRIAIRLHADELQREPVMRGIALEAEQVRRVVDVRDGDVDLPVVVDIAERRAAPGLRRRRRRAEPLGHVRKSSVAEIAVDDLSLLVRRLRLQRRDPG